MKTGNRWYTTDGRIRYSAVRDMVDRISRARMDRARMAFGEAFGHGPDWHGCIIHNALLSFSDGKPWSGVDYSALRRARWHEEHSFDASRILDGLYHRKSADSFAWSRED